MIDIDFSADLPVTLNDCEGQMLFPAMRQHPDILHWDLSFEHDPAGPAGTVILNWNRIIDPEITDGDIDRRCDLVRQTEVTPRIDRVTWVRERRREEGCALSIDVAWLHVPADTRLDSDQLRELNNIVLTVLKTTFADIVIR